jgi:hypothetical protein
MFDHVPILFGHELLKPAGKLYIVETHWDTSLYPCNRMIFPIGKTPLGATGLQEFEVK